MKLKDEKQDTYKMWVFLFMSFSPVIASFVEPRLTIVAQMFNPFEKYELIKVYSFFRGRGQNTQKNTF